MRGVPQSRQSPGKRVANKPSAAAVMHETRALSAASTLALTARVKSSLLLKTNLPTRNSAHSRHAGRILMKYSRVRLSHAMLGDVAYIGSWTRRGNRRVPVPRLSGADEDGTVAALETVGTTVGPQQQNGQEILFGNATPPRVKGGSITAVRTNKQHVGPRAIVRITSGAVDIV
jgi:hypothetical protein